MASLLRCGLRGRRWGWWKNLAEPLRNKKGVGGVDWDVGMSRTNEQGNTKWWWPQLSLQAHFQTSMLNKCTNRKPRYLGVIFFTLNRNYFCLRTILMPFSASLAASETTAFFFLQRPHSSVVAHFTGVCFRWLCYILSVACSSKFSIPYGERGHRRTTTRIEIAFRSNI